VQRQPVWNENGDVSPNVIVARRQEHSDEMTAWDGRAVAVANALAVASAVATATKRSQRSGDR